MSESEGGAKKELTGAVVELVRNAYSDAIQPIAKEAGKALGTVGKTVNVALTPLHALVWGYDKISDYVKTTVERKLEERNVPPERIQTPDPDVAVPALEALRYSKLRDNYANLLATSMDSETAHDAHPAFVEILKQLTPDEAKILKQMPKLGRSEPLVDIVYTTAEKEGEFDLFRNASVIGIEAKCDFPDITPKYIDNLCRLGLFIMPDGRHLVDDWRYDKVRDSELVKNILVNAPPTIKTEFRKKYIGLTNLGDGFIKACI